MINALCTFHKQTVAAVKFNEDISRNFVDGDKGKALELSKEYSKPIMVIVTEPGCEPCNRLKQSLNEADSDKLQGASRNTHTHTHFPQSQAPASIHAHNSTMLLQLRWINLLSFMRSGAMSVNGAKERYSRCLTQANRQFCVLKF